MEKNWEEGCSRERAGNGLGEGCLQNKEGVDRGLGGRVPRRWGCEKAGTGSEQGFEVCGQGSTGECACTLFTISHRVNFS